MQGDGCHELIVLGGTVKVDLNILGINGQMLGNQLDDLVAQLLDSPACQVTPVVSQGQLQPLFGNVFAPLLATGAWLTKPEKFA
jgi:hypothetical protein